MLTQSNINRINDMITTELRELKFSRNADRRQQSINNIKELKALLDECDPQQENELKDLVDSVRDLVRAFRR